MGESSSGGDADRCGNVCGFSGGDVIMWSGWV